MSPKKLLCWHIDHIRLRPSYEGLSFLPQFYIYYRVKRGTACRVELHAVSNPPKRPYASSVVKDDPLRQGSKQEHNFGPATISY